MNMKEEKICALCGLKITKVKGGPEKLYQLELFNGVHRNCLNKRMDILMKYRIDGPNYIAAVIDGLFELFPELKDTESLKDYKNREEEAKLELEKIFPYLKSDIIDKHPIGEEAEEMQRKYGTLT